jgi:Zn-dependent protease
MQVLVMERALSSFLAILSAGLGAMVLHEAGHLAYAWALGVKVKRIGVSLKGVYIVRAPGSSYQNLMISLAGPLTNVASLFLWHQYPLFGLANLYFVVFNLLPLRGSDGSRVLEILNTYWGEMRAQRV